MINAKVDLQDVRRGAHRRQDKVVAIRTEVLCT